MPSYHWSGDASVKRQSASGVISEIAYHVDELQSRAQGLHATAVTLCQQVTSQADALRDSRTHYRHVAAASASLVLLKYVLTADDHDVDVLQEWVNTTSPGAIPAVPGTLPYDIAEGLNGLGFGMLLGSALTRFGTLVTKGIIKAVGSTAATDIEGVAASLADTGISAGEVTAAEAGTEVATALAEGTLEGVSVASLTAAGAGAIITIGVEVAMGLINGKKTADHLNQVIDELNTKIGQLTSYSKALAAATDKTAAAIRSEQQRVKDILADLGKAFGTAKVAAPEPDPAHVSSTITATNAALNQYKIFVQVRAYWKSLVPIIDGDMPSRQVLDYFVMKCAPLLDPSITNQQIKDSAKIMARYSEALKPIADAPAPPTADHAT
jgi:hypothetical protein